MVVSDILAGHYPIDVTVSVLRIPAELRKERIGDWYIQIALELLPFERARGQRCRSAKLIAGRRGDDVDGPADRVPAEQCSLRTSQHFNALNVDEVEHRTNIAGDVDPIDVDSDARICKQREVELSHAAHEDGVGVRISRLRRRRDRETRRRGRDLREVIEGAALEIRSG